MSHYDVAILLKEEVLCMARLSLAGQDTISYPFNSTRKWHKSKHNSQSEKRSRKHEVDIVKDVEILTPLSLSSKKNRPDPSKHADVVKRLKTSERPLDKGHTEVREMIRMDNPGPLGDAIIPDWCI